MLNWPQLVTKFLLHIVVLAQFNFDITQWGRGRERDRYKCILGSAKHQHSLGNSFLIQRSYQYPYLPLPPSLPLTLCWLTQ